MKKKKVRVRRGRRRQWGKIKLSEKNLDLPGEILTNMTGQRHSQKGKSQERQEILTGEVVKGL